MSRKPLKSVAPAPEQAPPKPIGGMVETTWSGKSMWRCGDCHATTFVAGEAKVHVCKKPRNADEALTE